MKIKEATAMSMGQECVRNHIKPGQERTVHNIVDFVGEVRTLFFKS